MKGPRTVSIVYLNGEVKHKEVQLSAVVFMDKEAKGLCAEENKWVIPDRPITFNKLHGTAWDIGITDGEIIYEVPENAEMLFIRDGSNSKILGLDATGVETVEALKDKIKELPEYKDCRLTLSRPTYGYGTESIELRGKLIFPSNTLLNLSVERKAEVAPLTGATHTIYIGKELKDDGTLKNIGSLEKKKEPKNNNSEEPNTANRTLLSFLGLIFLGSASVAYAGCRYRGEVGGITPNMAKAGALIALVTVGIAVCLSSGREDSTPSRS